MTFKNITIDIETADGIVLASLKQQRKSLKQDLAAYKKGKYLHPEDVVMHQELIKHMDAIIRYYGG